MNIKLENLGWDEFFESKIVELGLEDFSFARVIAEYKGAYKIKNDEGEFLAKIKGKQLFEADSREDYPAVGDWVVITELDNEQAKIETIFPRKTAIKRRFGDKNRKGEKSDIQVIATNIDVAFIVQSVGRDYNVNRFERYLSIVKNTGIMPVIVINKIDLITSEDLESRLEEIRKRLEDIDVIPTSIVNDEGLDKLRSQIERGKTYCFLGSSGVGKSSLINRLLGKAIIKTGDVGLLSDRGKHVTTKREMYFLENGGILVDNPGIREVGMADSNEGVNGVFGEISRLAPKCKYADCTHIHEPGCAVLAAIQDEDLDRERYENYIDLKKEAAYFDMSQSEKRGKDRQFGKFMKNAKKELRKSGNKYF